MSVRSPRRPALRTRVREAVASAILEAAEEVAAAKGLDAASTSAIAARAGVAVGTLYNYFPDRDALIAALVAQRRGEMLPRLQAVADAGQGLAFEPRLRGYVAGVLGVFEAFRRYCRIAVTEDHQVVKARGGQRPVLDAITEALIEILGPRRDAAAHAHMIIGALKAMLRLRLERDEPLAADADLIVDTFLHGMAPA